MFFCILKRRTRNRFSLVQRESACACVSVFCISDEDEYVERKKKAREEKCNDKDGFLVHAKCAFVRLRCKRVRSNR